MNEEMFMQKCIELALIAKKRGDSPGGALVVRKGKIIAEGIEGGKTFRDITCHSEIEAIRHATEFLQATDLSDCELYTTHEPCMMCSYVIRHHKINRVIFGLATGEIGGVSSELPVLLDTSVRRWGSPPKLTAGVSENECQTLHEGG